MSKKFVWSPDNPEGALVDITTKEQAEIDAMIAAKAPAVPLWSKQRKKNYPSIGDQLDDLFKQGMFTNEMSAKIQAVKDKYPKEG